MKTVYEIIAENTENGRLPDNYSLPDEYVYSETPGLKWAPGALDGVTMYHMGHSRLIQEDYDLFASVLQAVSNGAENAAERFRLLGRKHRAINVIDEFQNYIREHAHEYDQQELLRFAVLDLIAGAHDTESVKYGLMITELYGECSEPIKDIIRTLGAYDEFTLFAAWNMNQWADRNEEIYRLAQKVTGWGRVHTVEMLDPTTPEIQDWLLYEGIHNSVLQEYSALSCMQKSGAIERLYHPLTDREFSAIGEIIQALLPEGPVPGISALEDAGTVLMNYLGQAENHTLHLKDYEVILDILNYAEEQTESQVLEDTARALLQSAECTKTINDAVKEGKGLQLAEALQIPYRKQLLEALRNDFEGNYTNCRYLMKDPAYIERTIDVFREHISPESIENNPQDETGLGQEFSLNNHLDYLLQELRWKLHTGEDYLLRTMSAVTVRNRSMTLRVLKTWVTVEQKPLQEVSPVLYERLKEAYKTEVREDLRESMKQLLDGKTGFPEEEM